MGILVLNHAETRTVMFTDLRDSTAQRVLLGDDTFDDLRRQHDRVLNAVGVSEHGGCVVKSTGDGIAHRIRCGIERSWHAPRRCSEGIARLNQGRSRSRNVCRSPSASPPATWWPRTEMSTAHRSSRPPGLCATARGGQVLVTDVVRLLAGTRGAHEFEHGAT